MSLAWGSQPSNPSQYLDYCVALIRWNYVWNRNAAPYCASNVVANATQNGGGGCGGGMGEGGLFIPRADYKRGSRRRGGGVREYVRPWCWCWCLWDCPLVCRRCWLLGATAAFTPRRRRRRDSFHRRLAELGWLVSHPHPSMSVCVNWLF